MLSLITTGYIGATVFPRYPVDLASGPEVKHNVMWCFNSWKLCALVTSVMLD